MLKIIVTLKRKLINPQIRATSRIEVLGGVKGKPGKPSKNIQKIAYDDALIEASSRKEPPRKVSRRLGAIEGDLNSRKVSRRSGAIAGGES